MPIDNNDIIKAIKANPEQGFRELMSRFMEPVYWHIRRLVVAHEDAQDAAQETFVRIYRSLDQYYGERSFSAWIYRIATNEALRMIERNNRRACRALDETDTSFTADAYIDYTDVEAVQLQRAIHTLPTKQQVAFNLRYYDEMSYEEIANVTGSTAGAAKSNYHLAKDKIVEYLKTND
ncbi:MAG: RNA polymerase sigma factor [Muribaculaceae bacterium]|nr:RNA polymerase sigma factor [Muribaculaceae bacterium]